MYWTNRGRKHSGGIHTWQSRRHEKIRSSHILINCKKIIYINKLKTNEEHVTYIYIYILNFDVPNFVKQMLLDR